MIQLLPRKEALKKNNILAGYVIDMQINFYSPELFSPGENWMNEEEKWVELSEEECARRNKPILDEFNNLRDNLDPMPELRRFTDESILSSEENDEVHIQKMATGLEELNDTLDWKGMLFIPEFPYSWLEFVNTNDEEQRRVADWFFNMGADKNFNGAVYASGEDLKDFIRLLIRFIASSQDFPICRFAGVDSSIIGSVCKYGNIHYLFYKDVEYTSFEKALKNTQLEEIPFGTCEYKF